MNPKQFAMAVKMTSFAAELDEAKNGFNLVMKHASISCVHELHTLAESLAGNRSNEIYAPDDEVVA